jgi:molybdopterin-guanine dinucleotide biosynthesis protein A
VRIGIALSGGKSSRMGRQKSSITVGDSTMLAHSVDLLNACNLDSVVLSGSESGIPDVFPNKGPVGGIHAVVVELSLKVGDILLILPNDMPLMRSDVLLQLLSHTETQQCTSIYENHPMPLCLYLSANVMAQFTQLESAKGMSIRHLIKVDKVALLQASNEQVFSNVNTPQELEDAVLNYQNMRTQP